MSTIQLTPEQQQAAHIIDRSVGIVANAGSGKTRVMVERVAHILAAGTARLSQTLVVTFTEKAAQELKSRLAIRLPDHQLDLMTAPITTFHGFAMRVLRDHAPTLGLPATFQILSEGEADALLHQAVEETLLDLLDHNDPSATLLCQRFKFRKLIATLIPLLEDRWSFGQYISSSVRGELVEPPIGPSTGSGRTVVNAIIDVFQKCTAHYTQLKRTSDSLDFHDLEIMTWQLFKDDERILSDYQRQFKHILVDEFQDTNPLQAEIVRLLFTPPDNVLCIVGDPKQSIYRFRRADVRCFIDMLAVISDSGGQTVVLPDNFRSAPAVVDFVNAVCTVIPNYTPLVAREPAPAFPSILAIPVLNEEKSSHEERRVHEAAAVAALMPELKERHGGFGKIACLFQTRASLNLWAEILRKSGLPVHLYSSGGFWSRPEIRTLLFPLHVIAGLETGKPDERHLLALLMSPLCSISLDEIYRWLQMRPKDSDSDLPPLHRAVYTNSAIAAQLTAWRAAATACTPHELMRKIIADTHYRETLLARDPSGQELASVEALLRRLHLMGRTQAQSLPLFLERLVELQNLNERTPDTPAAIVHDDAIQMMTIHAAKGNEFSAVVLGDLFRKENNKTPAWLFEPGMGFAIRNDDDMVTDAEDSPEWIALRDQYKIDDRAERDRLLYVALTRAERELILPIHPDLMKGKPNGNWHEQLGAIAHHSQ